MAGEDDSWSLEEMIQKSNAISRDTIERAAREAGAPGVISDEMNLHYGFLNDSMAQYGDEPKFMVYEHSPGFSSGETGLVKLQGKIPEDERPERIPGQSNPYRKDTEAQTDYIKLEVLPEEAMPRKAMYEDQDAPEGVLQHGEVEMQSGKTVTMHIHPWDEGQITGSDWQDNLQNYKRGDLRHRNN